MSKKKKTSSEFFIYDGVKEERINDEKSGLLKLKGILEREGYGYIIRRDYSESGKLLGEYMVV